jgi:hypothetical protein
MSDIPSSIQNLPECVARITEYLDDSKSPLHAASACAALASASAEYSSAPEALLAELDRHCVLQKLVERALTLVANDRVSEAAANVLRTLAACVPAAVAEAGALELLVARAELELRCAPLSEAAERIAARVVAIAVPLCSSPAGAGAIVAAGKNGSEAGGGAEPLVRLCTTLLECVRRGGSGIAEAAAAAAAVLSALTALAGTRADGVLVAVLAAGALRCASNAYALAHEHATPAAVGWALCSALGVIAAVGEAQADLLAIKQRREQPIQSAASMLPDKELHDHLNIRVGNFTATTRSLAALRLLSDIDSNYKGRAIAFVGFTLEDIRLRDQPQTAILAMRALHVLAVICDIPVVRFKPACSHPYKLCRSAHVHFALAILCFCCFGLFSSFLLGCFVFREAGVVLICH